MANLLHYPLPSSQETADVWTANLMPYPFLASQETGDLGIANRMQYPFSSIIWGDRKCLRDGKPDDAVLLHHLRRLRDGKPDTVSFSSIITRDLGTVNLLQYPSLASQETGDLRIAHLIQYPSLAFISGDRRLRDCKPHSLSFCRNPLWRQEAYCVQTSFIILL